MKYNFSKTEKHWREIWGKEGIYEPSFRKAKQPFYNLMMFPYPSAEGLHVGNMYAFTGSDVYGRMKRMQGNDVFEPIGLDGFGIHSENYALKIGAHPMEQAKVSEKRFYQQLQTVGNGFAWNEKLETYNPDYYKWTQWIFLQLFKKGLAYRKKQPVNWCPSCKTVLADEQVILRAAKNNPEQMRGIGVCERCETPVIKKELEQWFFKITDYAERLLKNLDKLDWSEKVKIAQRNWIGKSEGALIKFPISNFQFPIEVFTTRPDTLFGATYLVLAPEHPFVASLLEVPNSKFQLSNKPEVQKYINRAKTRTQEERTAEVREKTGVELNGIKAINPANKEEIPVWVADYVLGGYGTGAIMAVPAHDERDFEFAEKYQLPIRRVVANKNLVRSIVWGKDITREKLESVGVHIIEEVKTGNTEYDEVIKKVEFSTDRAGAFEKLVREKLPAGFWNEYVGPMGVVFNFKNTDGDIERYVLDVRNEVQIDRKCYEFFHKKKPDERWRAKNVWKSLADAEGGFYRSLIVHSEGGELENSGKFSGMDSETAKWEITKFVSGEKKVQYRLRDWLISRQRYWGPPIPIIYCRKCWEATSDKRQGIRKGMREGIDYAVFDGEEHIIHAVPEEDLPVELPYVKDFRPQGKGESPLASVEKFYKVKCPGCKGEARRETDVSDTFLDSAWYFIGYLIQGVGKLSAKGESASGGKAKSSSFSSLLTRKWLPVHSYIGGAEHSVLHLLYARFVTMALHDMKLLHFEEPFTKFRAHGLLIKEGAKMSKSKGNVVNPDEYVKKFGVDTLRMYLMFLAPFEQGGDFRDAGILGLERFLMRVWHLAISKSEFLISKEVPSPKSQNLERALHQTIKKVTEDIENLHYNTAISTLMILLNEFEAQSLSWSRSSFEAFLKLLAPFAPYMAEEIWREVLGNKTSIHLAPWPEYDPEKIKEDTFTLVIQVDGRVRDTIEGVAVNISEEEARALALSREKVQAHCGGKTPQRVVYIRGRIVNIVL